MTGPLAGIRVLELVAQGPAPFACMMLADLGAEVIGVERPGTHRYEPDAHSRGRRSVALDLKQPEGREDVHDLVREVDDAAPEREVGGAVGGEHHLALVVLLAQDGEDDATEVPEPHDAPRDGHLVPEQQVVDGLRVERGHLGERGLDDLGAQVVGAHAGERALERPPDRGAGGGDDDGFGHGWVLLVVRR